MRKKTLMILTTVITLSLSMLVGCGNQQETNNPSTEQPTTTESTTTNEPTSAPAEAPTKTEEPAEPQHEHAYTEVITTEATCEADGVKTFTCDCGDSYTEVITAIGHNYGEYVSNNDATYTADGTETATCVCGLTDTRTAEGSKLEYTYTDLDKTMYAKQSVNVRDLPSTDGNKLGGLSAGQEVKVTGQCNETSWYRIEYSGGVAYVSNSYLQNDKPVEETPAPSQSAETENEDLGKLINTMVDNGDHIIVYIWNGQGDNLDLFGEAMSILANRYGCSEFDVFRTLQQTNAGYYNGYDIWENTFRKP